MKEPKWFLFCPYVSDSLKEVRYFCRLPPRSLSLVKTNQSFRDNEEVEVELQNVFCLRVIRNFVLDYLSERLSSIH